MNKQQSEFMEVQCSQYYQFNFIMMNMQLKRSNSKSENIENVRAKLQNIHAINYSEVDTLVSIDKRIQKHNQKIDDPEVLSKLQDKQESQITIDNKLWNYFVAKSKYLQNKIEREQVNGYRKILTNILHSADKKIKSKETAIESMEQEIKNHYQAMHELFQQVEQVKLQKTKERERAQRRKRSNLNTNQSNVKTNEANCDKKMEHLKQEIEELKQKIEEKAQSNEQVKAEFEIIKEEKKSILVNFVKEGYYLEDGIAFFLHEMVEIGYRPTHDIFPKFLDARSKQYLLQEYDEHERKHKQGKANTERTKFSRLRAKSNINLGSLAKKEHMKDIYKGTKEYIMKLLLQQQFKKQTTQTQSSIKLPTIRKRDFKNGNLEELRQTEKRRIRNVYPDQTREHVKKILFGIKLETFGCDTQF